MIWIWRRFVLSKLVEFGKFQVRVNYSLGEICFYCVLDFVDFIFQFGEGIEDVFSGECLLEFMGREIY